MRVGSCEVFCSESEGEYTDGSTLDRGDNLYARANGRAGCDNVVDKEYMFSTPVSRHLNREYTFGILSSFGSVSLGLRWVIDNTLEVGSIERYRSDIA